MRNDDRHRTVETVAIAPQQRAKIAGFEIPTDRNFIIVHGDTDQELNRGLRAARSRHQLHLGRTQCAVRRAVGPDLCAALIAAPTRARAAGPPRLA